MRTAIIQASKFIEKNAARCPQCDSNTITLEGFFKRRFTETVIEGAPFDCQLETHIEKAITDVICRECNIRFVIETDEQFLRAYENVALRKELAERDGLSVVPEKKTNRVN